MAYHLLLNEEEMYLVYFEVFVFTVLFCHSCIVNVYFCNAF